MQIPKVKSLAKALEILECFSVEKPELGITQLSEMLGLYKSNVHNIISTFEQYGYIEQNPATMKYRLGFKILELAHILNADLGMHKIITPVINELAREVDEVVYFAIPQNGQVLYLDGGYPASFFAVRSMMGEKAEMYCTAIGKAILAFLPDKDKTDAIEKQSFSQHTDKTIASKEELLLELNRIQLRGYSIDNMEHEYGIRCVAVPVFNLREQLMGAISISAPSPRITQDLLEEYAEKLHHYAKKITLLL